MIENYLIIAKINNALGTFYKFELIFKLQIFD